MSEASSQDKTEKASAKRLRDARQRGQVPRSRELSTGLVVAAAVMVLSGAGPGIAQEALAFMRDALSIAPEMLGDPGRMPWTFAKRLGQGFMAASALFAATLAAALLAPMLIGGFNVSMQAIQPQWSRIDPWAGLGRLLSMHGLVELTKSLLKFLMIGAISAWYVWAHLEELMRLSSMDLQQAAVDFGALAIGMLVWGTGALALIAAIDAPYQLWHHHHQLRMSKQEVKDEYKQSEGRPEVKGRIRRMQHEMSRRRMMEAIPGADVVVTNPTHYAVALKYSMGAMKAPVVVAKGSGEVAAAIRDKAREHRIALISAPPLARALYRQVPLGKEIPAVLYAAVAQVLTYIFQLRNWRHGQPWPQLAPVGDVPGGEPDPD